MGNRKAATEFILKNVALIDPDDKSNVELIKNRLDALSDTEFDQLMHEMQAPPADDPSRPQTVLPYYVPNLAKSKISVIRNIEVARAIGHEFFERLWITDAQSGETFLTPNKYIVIDLPLRRQAQLLIKKASIPTDHKSIDELSGQVTGESKGSKLSFPELQAQVSQGMDSTIIEEIKIRGGDEQAYKEFERQMIETGSATQASILGLGTKVKSTVTLSNLLKGMHLDNNLAD